MLELVLVIVTHLLELVFNRRLIKLTIVLIRNLSNLLLIDWCLYWHFLLRNLLKLVFWGWHASLHVLVHLRWLLLVLRLFKLLLVIALSSHLNSLLPAHHDVAFLVLDWSSCPSSTKRIVGHVFLQFFLFFPYSFLFFSLLLFFFLLYFLLELIQILLLLLLLIF